MKVSLQSLSVRVYKYRYKLILIAILLFSFITKAWNIAYPDSHYFDEIYYGFTAEEYAKGNLKAWVWDYTPPEGFAYTWDHPPTGKLIMAGFVKLFDISSTSRRLAPLFAGALLPLVVYFLAKTAFPDKNLLAIIAALLTAFEGLVLSLSRIALTDTMLTMFIGLTILFLWKRSYLISAIFFGLALSTKWTGIYLIPIIGITLLVNSDWKKKAWKTSVVHVIKTSLLYACTGLVIYLISYLPLFIHYGGQKFVDLHQQMWWYHTNLKATHPAQSAAYLWPINYRPVWFYVDYQNKTTGNIYAMLNPAIAWGGIIAVALVSFWLLETKSKNLFLILLAYFMFWVPWIFSPRIMFLYHYLPSVPFLILCLAYALHRLYTASPQLGQYAAAGYVIIVFVLFIFFFPYWTGIQVPNDFVDNFRWLKSWGP
jgi:dolichyl-phosphate-mannose-protein mannosyltransferase